VVARDGYNEGMHRSLLVVLAACLLTTGASPSCAAG